MTVEYIRYQITEDQRAPFIEAIRNASQILTDSPDCLSHQLSHCQEETANFIWRIEWVSVDRHLNGFRKSEAFRQFFRFVSPYVNNIQEMHHYEPIVEG